MDEFGRLGRCCTNQYSHLSSSTADCRSSLLQRHAACCSCRLQLNMETRSRSTSSLGQFSLHHPLQRQRRVLPRIRRDSSLDFVKRHPFTHSLQTINFPTYDNDQCYLSNFLLGTTFHLCVKVSPVSIKALLMSGTLLSRIKTELQEFLHQDQSPA